MTMPDLTSTKTIREIVSGTIEWPNAPWKSAGDSEPFYRKLCTDISERLGLKSKNEFDNYGCGYASFLDAWFYKDHSDFRVESPQEGDQSFVGLFVLLNRHTPHYVMGEGEKSWNDTSGFFYLPDASMVDDFKSSAVEALSSTMERQLSDRGLIRLRSAEVLRPIPKDIKIETNMSDGELRLFDALFHWMD